jgi:hypothetical protein
VKFLHLRLFSWLLWIRYEIRLLPIVAQGIEAIPTDSYSFFSFLILTREMVVAIGGLSDAGGLCKSR